MSFRHAVELLRAGLPNVAAAAAAVKVSTVRKLPPPVEREPTMRACWNRWRRSITRR